MSPPNSTPNSASNSTPNSASNSASNSAPDSEHFEPRYLVLHSGTEIHLIDAEVARESHRQSNISVRAACGGNAYWGGGTVTLRRATKLTTDLGSVSLALDMDVCPDCCKIALSTKLPRHTAKALMAIRMKLDSSKIKILW